MSRANLIVFERSDLRSY